MTETTATNQAAHVIHARQVDDAIALYDDETISGPFDSDIEGND